MSKTLYVPLVAASMLLSVLAGCTGSNEQGNTKTGTSTSGSSGAEAKPADKKFEFGKTPLEFSLYGNYDWYTMPNWGEDLATKWIKENKKVNVIPVSSGGNAKQKFNTMIVSNQLPDVMWLERGADVEKLRQAGALVPFDDYLNKYPNMKKWVGEKAINMLRSSDGKIYQFPNWYSTKPAGNAGYVINKKIYAELGSPKLETTEDLYNYLKLVKQKYPNVIPLEPGLKRDGLNVMYSAFAENHSPTYIGMLGVPNNGKLTSIFTDTVFREMMQYESRLFREKLIDQDNMTHTNDQLKEKVVGAKVAVYVAASPTGITVQTKDVNDQYMMVWPIHKEGVDKNKIFTGSYNSLGWNVSVITKAAKNPEAIFAFLDWLTGPEGERNIFWGPEGLYWNGVDSEEAPMFTDKFTSDAANREKLMAITNNFQWVGNSVYIDSSKVKFQNKLPEEQRDWATRYQSSITWKTHDDATEFVNLAPAPDSNEGIISQSMTDIFDKATTKALYAKTDEEVLAILDQAEKDAQAAGYSKLLQFKTGKWQENVQKISGKK